MPKGGDLHIKHRIWMLAILAAALALAASAQAESSARYLPSTFRTRVVLPEITRILSRPYFLRSYPQKTAI